MRVSASASDEVFHSVIVRGKGQIQQRHQGLCVVAEVTFKNSMLVSRISLLSRVLPHARHQNEP